MRNVVHYRKEVVHEVIHNYPVLSFFCFVWKYIMSRGNNCRQITFHSYAIPCNGVWSRAVLSAFEKWTNIDRVFRETRFERSRAFLFRQTRLNLLGEKNGSGQQNTRNLPEFNTHRYHYQRPDRKTALRSANDSQWNANALNQTLSLEQFGDKFP